MNNKKTSLLTDNTEQSKEEISIYLTVNSNDLGDRVKDQINNAIIQARENGDYLYITINSGIPPNPPPGGPPTK